MGGAPFAIGRYENRAGIYSIAGFSHRRDVSESGTGGNESLASLIVLELLEVVDEHLGELGSLCSPFCGICVGVAGVEDLGINAGQFGGYGEVEDRNLLGGSLQDSAVEDSVDDTAGITDGDTFAGTVPAGVHQISFCAGLVHLLDEFLGILCGMEAEEGSAEAGRESGGRFGDTALCTGQFRGEARQEVILGLLGSQDGNGGQNAESVSRQEDNVLGGGTVAARGDLLDVVDGVGHAGVLGHRLVGEVDFALVVYGNVLQESVATDGVIDVGFGFLVEVDNLGIAAALIVEDAVVVPAVFVVADKQTLGVGGKGGFAGSGQTEEDGGVLAVHVGVGRAVHGSHALEGKVVVHDGEHTLLHFTAVPGVDDDLHTLGEVEGHAGLGVDAEFFPVGYFGLRCVQNHEVGLEVLKLILGGAHEHIGHEVSLPCHFHDEAYSQTGVLVGAAESVDNIQGLVGQLLVGDSLQGVPGLGSDGLVVVLVFVGSPPDGIVGNCVVNKELVFGGTAGVDTGHHVHCAEFGFLTLLVAFETGLGFVDEEFVPRGVVDNLRGAGDTVLG